MGKSPPSEARVIVSLMATVLDPGVSRKLRYLPHPWTILVKGPFLARPSKCVTMAACGENNRRVAGERQEKVQKWEQGLQPGHNYSQQRDCRPLYGGYSDNFRVPARDISRVHAIPTGCQRAIDRSIPSTSGCSSDYLSNHNQKISDVRDRYR